MQAIFNRQGFVVGWISGKDLYDVRGNFIGFFIAYAVYNKSSQYCGTLKHSFFRDVHGQVVAFMGGAKGGAALPTLKALPSKPIKNPRPSTKVVPPPPVTKPPKPSWSKLDWEVFIQ